MRSSADRRLSIVYLLDDTALFGGVKVVLEQADWMHRRGHEVLVASPGPPPDWHPLQARFLRLLRLAPELLPAADVVVATFWTTVATAAAAAGRPVHYCQGYEGSYGHNRADHAAIEAAYRRPLPAFAVAAHLAVMLRDRFGKAARVVPQPLGAEFRAGWRLRPGRPPRIAVVSPFEIDWKGVATALETIARLRESGFDCRLIRVSQWPQTAEERAALAADEFHCRVPPQGVARVLRDCDLLLAPSWEAEGFGLPALEAMASGVPVIASDVGCYRSWAAEAAVLVPPRDIGAFADAARELLASAGAWRRARGRGLRLARAHHEARAVAATEAAFYWVADGAESDTAAAGAATTT